MPVRKSKSYRYLLPSTDRDTAVLLMLTVAVAICVKLLYSNAGADELRWILFPTAELVKVFSSISFLFEPGKGYVGLGAPIVIGPGCAGLNFFVIALCMSNFAFIGHFEKHKLYGFLGLVLLTYVVTLCVNAFRIVGGVMLLEFGRSMNFAVSDLIHSVQGTLFYFVFLVVYFVALRAILKQRNPHEDIH